jgi:GNAT superfamily N-acetyltransferase
MELVIKQTQTSDPDFKLLVAELDAAMQDIYKSYDENFTSLNILKSDTQVIVAYASGEPVGCGAIRKLDEPNTVELKRMFVKPAFRGKGISKIILQQLESLALSQGNIMVRLETGSKQPVAIALYKKCGYTPTAAFGPYTHIPGAVCMKKILARL